MDAHQGRKSRGPRVGVISALALVATSLALLWPTAALAQSRPKIEILGQDTLTVNASPDTGTATTFLSVLNDGSSVAKIKVTFQASSVGNVVRVDHSLPRTQVKPREAERVPVVLTGLTRLGTSPVDGQLVVHGGHVPAARALTVIPATDPFTDWPKVLLIGAGVVSLALVLIVILYALLECEKGWKEGLKRLTGPAPGPEWGLDRWAASLVVIATVFGSVTGTLTLPPVPSQISKATLLQLNVFFAAVILIGPFIFQAARKLHTKVEERKKGLWGSSPVLLVSYGITAGAVVGELATLALLMWEVTGGGTAGVLAIVGVSVLSGLALWYFFVTAFQEVSENWEERGKEADNAAKLPQNVALDALPVWVSTEPHGADQQRAHEAV